MKFILTKLSTKKNLIFYDLDDALIAYNNLIIRNKNLTLLVDFCCKEAYSEDATLEYVIIANGNGVVRDDIIIIADKAERLYNNNIKAIKCFEELARKRYYPVLLLGNKRIAYEFINYTGITSKNWDED